MKPNELGKAAGFSKRDVTRMGRAERDAETALELVKAYEQMTGQPCEDSEACSEILEKFAFLRERFFEPEPEDELEG